MSEVNLDALLARTDPVSYCQCCYRKLSPEIGRNVSSMLQIRFRCDICDSMYHYDFECEVRLQ